MRIQQAEQKIEEAGGDVKIFWHWMRDQTCSLDKDGYVDVHDYDVDRFIRYKCDPKNEPLSEFD